MELKDYRIKSILGLLIFLVGLVVCGMNMKQPIFFGIGLAVTIFGWLIFSSYHTKIAIHDLKKITEEYMKK